MAKQPENKRAIEMIKGSTIGKPTGGSFTVGEGDVLIVGDEQDVTPGDAAYLVGLKKARYCDPALKKAAAKKAAAAAPAKSKDGED